MAAGPVRGLYPIIDTDLCAARRLDPLAVAAGCLRGGARLLQLRAKSLPPAQLLPLATRMVRTAAEHGGIVIVNDRADLARLAGAGGVHVGQDDLPPAEVRLVFGEGLIGLSTHDPAQVDAALASGVDYVAVGPVFGTATKDTGYTARGAALVTYAAGRGTPIVAIGGMTVARAALARAAGASAVAVISDLLAGDPEARTRAYLDAWG